MRVWHEADHPRDPRGRFSGRGAWVKKVDDRLISGQNWPDQLSQRVKADNPGVKLDLYRSSAGHVVLSRIVVPQRSQGTGSLIMGEITRLADDNRDTLALDPSSDFGGTKSRLVKFYRRFGFVENKGRNKDYGISEAMYRPPAR